MMRNDVIYEKRFPKLEQPSLDEMEEITASSNDEKEHLTFEEIMERIYKDVVYILMPERVAKAKSFIRKAIAVSELYEMDIKIEHHLSYISVNYYFDCGGCMKHLIEIISEADEIAFFRPKEGYDIIMSLDFYTHAVYRKGRRIEP